MRIEHLFVTLERVELARDLTPAGLRDVLAELGERVAPVTLARARVLPVPEPLRRLCPEGGLVRGRVHACAGGGATTVALSLVRDALLAGEWMAIVDVPTFGADAANELGLPLERVVRIETALEHDDTGHDRDDHDDHDEDRSSTLVRRWLEVMGAAVDGFDVVMVGVPDGLRGARQPAALRSLIARVQQRGAVVIVLGPIGVVPVDVTYTSTSVWDGLGQGHGVVRRRRLEVVAAGRRQPEPVRAAIDLDVVGTRRLSLLPASTEPPALTVVDDPVQLAAG